jgi:plastocyanin
MSHPIRLAAVSSCVAALALIAGCSKAGAPPATAGAGKHVDQATAGTIQGRVAFEGKPPASTPIKMAVDPACVAGNTPNPVSDAVLVGKSGELQNVFVYVKDGLDAAYSFDMPSTPVTLTQKGCVYTPRVFGVRVGQPIDVVNDDATSHNVHGLPKVNQEFNRMEPMQGFRMAHTFTAPEVMVRFKCDVHNWMAAYVGVLAHPFFAVSKPDGTFEIQGLPPGTYTIEAWHEKFGTREQKVTLGERQTQAVSFSFTATTP